ncbi:RagB/SusD family nutrient uptake outer membrane protein [Chitinophaga alhagiae]|uniref:RagB/SusD family nutrient uptake outer membrane protein n=1 Tax=Chitinophaga alhagiae TaxID=2203219 RepID=UPI000E5AEEAE|nr:RagB/SusD family nutrient uptake outer membrane protein [Chitinophaga alhagiae]
MKKLLSLYVLLIFLVSGCAKLDETPMSSISPDQFYTTPGQVESAFAAAMNALWGYWYGYGIGMESFVGIFVHDDQIYGGDLVISSYAGADYWRYHYNALLNINTALHAVLSGKVQNTPQDQLDLLTGQAKFLRAFNYFMLVRLYGGVPLYTDGENPLEQPEARASVEEVYAQIVSDLQDAASKLPATWPENLKGRPASGAANALLAKVYITMATAPLNKTENYALAAAAAKKVIDSHVYALTPDVNDVFKYENKYGPEMIWSFISTADDVATDGQIWTGAEAPFYGWEDITADDTFAVKYPEQPRKNAYLVLYNEEGKHYTEWEVASKRAGIRKYLYGPLDELNAYQMTFNIPILRYADVLLLYAEALNMANGGPNTDAVNAVNEIINRANGGTGAEPLATLSMTKEQFDEKVLQERSWELCFEYDRLFDIYRKRILKKVTQETLPWYVVNFSEDDYLLPIPEVDLRLNKLLVQNPGYVSP